VDEVDEHPWKLKSKEAMAFTMEEVLAYDAHMFNIQGKLTKTMHVHQLAALQVRRRRHHGDREAGTEEGIDMNGRGGMRPWLGVSTRWLFQPLS
jgi:hypothetical protein